MTQFELIISNGEYKIHHNYSLEEFNYLKTVSTHKPVAEPIICKDGFTVSIQASEFAYATPREDNPTGLYTEVELGFPSENMGPEFLPYCENPDDPTESVYRFVPIELVQKLIEKHGGEVC